MYQRNMHVNHRIMKNDYHIIEVAERHQDLKLRKKKIFSLFDI
jgi:hypothetical protein